jgi:hypothetical protein
MACIASTTSSRAEPCSPLVRATRRFMALSRWERESQSHSGKPQTLSLRFHHELLAQSSFALAFLAFLGLLLLQLPLVRPPLHVVCRAATDLDSPPPCLCRSTSSSWTSFPLSPRRRFHPSPNVFSPPLPSANITHSITQHLIPIQSVVLPIAPTSSAPATIDVFSRFSSVLSVHLRLRSRSSSARIEDHRPLGGCPRRLDGLCRGWGR